MLLNNLQQERIQKDFPFPEIISEFGAQLKECMSVGIMIEYFCRKRLHFEWNKTMSSFRLITYSLVPLLLLKQQQQGLFEL